MCDILPVPYSPWQGIRLPFPTVSKTFEGAPSKDLETSKGVQRDANSFGEGAGCSTTMNAFRLVTRYVHEPNGVLKSVLKPLGDGQAELTTYTRAYKGDGTVKVTVRKSLLPCKVTAKTD